MWLSSSNILFTKIGRGLDLAHRPEFANPDLLTSYYVTNELCAKHSICMISILKTISGVGHYYYHSFPFTDSETMEISRD